MLSRREIPPVLFKAVSGYFVQPCMVAHMCLVVYNDSLWHMLFRLVLYLVIISGYRNRVFLSVILSLNVS